MKEVKTKNYFVLLLIILSTIIISLYLFSWYKQYDNNFVKDLSIIDVLMFNSKEKVKMLLNACCFI